MRTLVIPDVHVKPEHLDLSHIDALARFICHHKPENVVFIGDFWDLPTLFADKRSKQPDKREWKIKAEGRRIWTDVEAGKKAFDIIQNRIKRTRRYSPRQVFCEGNHEDELRQHFNRNPCEDNPERDPKRSILNRHNIEDFVRGWGVEFVPFLKPAVIEGVIFSHYFRNDNGNAVQISTAHSNLYRYSHVWGHSHKWGYKQDSDQLGGKIFWLCTGTFRRPEGTGSRHWSGITILHHNGFGDCDVEQVSVERLLSEFG